MFASLIRACLEARKEDAGASGPGEPVEGSATTATVVVGAAAGPTGDAAVRSDAGPDGDVVVAVAAVDRDIGAVGDEVGDEVGASMSAGKSVVTETPAEQTGAPCLLENRFSVLQSRMNETEVSNRTNDDRSEMDDLIVTDVLMDEVLEEQCVTVNISKKERNVLKRVRVGVKSKKPSRTSPVRTKRLSSLPLKRTS